MVEFAVDVAQSWFDDQLLACPNLFEQALNQFLCYHFQGMTPARP